MEEYTGASVLEDHLYHFENASLLHQYSNGVKSVSNDSEKASTWFSQLKMGSIYSFEEFNILFLHYFSSIKHYHKSPPQSFLDEATWSRNPARVHSTFQPWCLGGAFNYLQDPNECILLGAIDGRLFYCWWKSFQQIIMTSWEGWRSI